MDLVHCKDCEFFLTNQNEMANVNTSDWTCSNTSGLVHPTPNDYCSRAIRAKKSSGPQLDQEMLDKLLAQRRG